MDIDKLIQPAGPPRRLSGFGSLMDIDKLIRLVMSKHLAESFGSLMDIDKLIRVAAEASDSKVLVL